ncbi:MAG: hypothetical protein COA78_23090 [Blastopirellula sp.]|nr:MAG: hypothetical protein COA78_23090 [Blastopirellula sp.]
MDTINSAAPYFDQQAQVAIWYAEYHGPEEQIKYTNGLFSQAFGISVEDILSRKRYHLVNPPETSSETIEQYKAEDKTAIEHGCFYSRNILEQGKDIEVLKLRFDAGVLGMFKIVESQIFGSALELKDLDADLIAISRQVRPDLVIH